MPQAIDSVIDRFAEHSRRRGLRPASIELHTKVLWRASRNFDLLTATGQEITAWLDSLDVTSRSRNAYLKSLRCFYRWAEVTELIDRNPTTRIEFARLPRLLPRPIATEDLALALSNADPRMRLILSLAAFGGLRAGEIVRLRGKDVDLAAKTIRVDGKGGAERVVPLSQEAEVALLAYGLRPGRLIFTRLGQPCRSGFISDAVVDYFTSLGMPWTCHQLRHWYATTLYRQTRDLLFVQAMLGHASVATTQIYARLTPSAEALQIVRGLSA